MITDFWLILGYGCNNRCIHCYAKQKNFKSEWMDINFAFEALETLVAMGAKNCLLIGGEPTLYKKLPSLIKHGDDNGLNMILISNGRKLKDYKYTESLYRAGLNRIIISIEGKDAFTHNFITGCNSFKETLEGIKTCSAIGRVNSLTTICQFNHEQIIEIAELSRQNGAEKTVFNFEIPSTNFSDAGNRSIVSFNPEQMARAAESAYLIAKKRNMQIYINCTIPACLFDGDIFKDMLDNRAISLGCHMYNGKGVAFDAEKNILPCTHFADAYLEKRKSEEYDQLSLKRDFIAYWHDKESSAGKFRSALWKYPNIKCETCEFWGGCIGGCPLLWGKFDPDKFIIGRR